MSENTRIQSRTKSQVGEQSTATTEVSKVSITVVAVFGVLVGLWSLACIVGGLAASGGPLQFIGNWFTAVTGG